MVSLETLVWLGGLLHFSLLVAGVLVPIVLQWHQELARLSRMTREIIWVHGVFLVFVILGFAAASLFLSNDLVSGTVLARSLCGFIAVFWCTRLAVQLFLFDPGPLLRHWFLRLGYHGLTGVFTYFVGVYATAALVGVELSP